MEPKSAPADSPAGKLPPLFALFFNSFALECGKQEAMNDETTLLWELWAAQVLCTAAAMLPGSRVCTMPGLALPALGLAAAVPTAWFVWGVWAEPPLPLPPEQLLEPPRTLDPATLLDLPEPVA